MQKIIPHLWFDKEAIEASNFYAETFPDSKVTMITQIKDTPSGDCDLVDFEVMGFKFSAISAGPYFKLNPAISFMVNFDPSKDKDALTRIDEIWSKLCAGGKVLMPIDRYPFSERYGWVEDRYGVSWQLILTKPEGEPRPVILPTMLFVTDTGRQAEEATNFYLSVFEDARRGALVRYGAGMDPNPKEAVMFTDFTLAGQWFVAMDASKSMHEFAFNEAVSFMINCEDQTEIDYYWDKLSAVPESEQCGWVKDKYGVSWQIVPTKMAQLMARNPAKTTPAMMAMKKIIIADLEKAGN